MIYRSQECAQRPIDSFWGYLWNPLWGNWQQSDLVSRKDNTVVQIWAGSRCYWDGCLYRIADCRAGSAWMGASGSHSGTHSLGQCVPCHHNDGKLWDPTDNYPNSVVSPLAVYLESDCSRALVKILEIRVLCSCCSVLYWGPLRHTRLGLSHPQSQSHSILLDHHSSDHHHSLDQVGHSTRILRLCPRRRLVHVYADVDDQNESQTQPGFSP